MKSVVVVEGEGGDAEAAPVHIYAFRGAALEVDAAEGEDVLAVAAGGDTLVGDRAVVDVLDCGFEFLQAELETGAAGEEEVR